jgi:NitT/TauT family transport system substrate-binding protein
VLYSQVPIIEAQGTPLNVMLWADHGMNLISNGIVATRSIAKKNPQLVRDFIAGLVQGINYAKTHQAEAVGAYMNHFPQENRAVATEATRLFLSVLDSTNTKGQPTGYQSPADWAASVRILTAAGLMKTPGPAASYFTNAFLPKTKKK